MRPRDRISIAIGGAALVVAVLAIGGALRWTQAVIAGLVGLALVMQIGSRRRLDQRSPLVVLLGVAIALTAIQLIPLPAGVLDALDHRGNELRNDGAALAGTAPWHVISLDPPGTIAALAFLVTLLGVALLGLRIASSERGRYLVLAAVAVTCGVAAAVTGVHTLLHADRLYGIYRPLHAVPPILGPLLNTNHLGGLMAIGAVIAVGLAFYQRQVVQLRVLWVVIAIGCSATAMASLSRGATLGMALGVATLIALFAAGRIATVNDGGTRRHHALIAEVPITIVIAAGLAVAVYTSAGKVADQLENTSLAELNHPLSKYEAWRSAFQLVDESPWVGIGRGAIEPVFTRVHAPSAYVTFSHLENEYIQAIVEWGVPGAVLIGLALAWCIAHGGAALARRPARGRGDRRVRRDPVPEQRRLRDRAVRRRGAGRADRDHAARRAAARVARGRRPVRARRDGARAGRRRRRAGAAGVAQRAGRPRPAVRRPRDRGRRARRAARGHGAPPARLPGLRRGRRGDGPHRRSAGRPVPEPRADAAPQPPRPAPARRAHADRERPALAGRAGVLARDARHAVAQPPGGRDRDPVAGGRARGQRAPGRRRRDRADPARARRSAARRRRRALAGARDRGPAPRPGGDRSAVPVGAAAR